MMTDTTYVIKCRLKGEAAWTVLTSRNSEHEAQSVATRWIANFPWPPDTDIKVFAQQR